MVVCKICGKKFKMITHTHLKKAHNINSIPEYVEMTGGEIGSPDFGKKDKLLPIVEQQVQEEEEPKVEKKPRTISDILAQRGLKER